MALVSEPARLLSGARPLAQSASSGSMRASMSCGWSGRPARSTAPGAQLMEPSALKVRDRNHAHAPFFFLPRRRREKKKTKKSSSGDDN